MVNDFDQELHSTLESLDDAVNYANWITHLFQPFLQGEILEIGAGHGTMSERLSRYGNLTATEPYEEAALLLADRFREDSKISVHQADALSAVKNQTFNSIVMINVLEHIEDDKGTVQILADSLTPNGHLAVYVPAFQLLYSKFDRDIGHFRRYRKKELEKLMTDAGLKIVRSSYVNLPGAFLWLLSARILRMTPTKQWSTQLYDKFAVPVVRRVESLVTVPFGQSLFCVGRKN
jgi:2-polyprenyl-3-methyl-5-hydroxy-6-metoxy-1,4-benzoquinol methylase